VSGRIDNINTVIIELRIHPFPKASGSGAGNGDTALLFLLHPIHGGGTIMYFTNFVGHASVKKNALGSGGLACIYVSTNADVSITTYGCLACHNIFLCLKTKKGGY
jgi:hypothetical protein